MRDTVLEQYLAKMGFLRDDYIVFHMSVGSNGGKRVYGRVGVKYKKTQ